ncbi:DnaD domain-containing protein [Shimazuella kribbensis]|uniref:DnaD domain-containing protein n=1 Tax=Shimazuella kribbensis TaxID=139808 RepID=UPI00041D73FB|nr:DnaD domain protein [Shimazuella kribbensis]
MKGNEKIRAMFVQLLQKGTIPLPVALFTEYKRLGLRETEVLLLTQLLIFQEKEKIAAPTFQELSYRMNLTIQEIADMVAKLSKDGWVGIGSKGEKGYDLSLIYERLVASIEEEDDEIIIDSDEQYQTLFHLIEQEFGRPLSPNECEHIIKWLDEDLYPEELIEAALREAVYCEKISIRYMDRILMEWERHQIRTAEQAIQFSKRFRQPETPVQPKRSTSEFTFYNWLEG